RLIGAPPGYVGYDEGGQITEQIRRRPYQVVLFDEIEKAHPDVFNALLQVLDDGRLTDGQGRTVDFRNTVIIMTSNAGTEHLRTSGIGFSAPGRSIASNKQLDLKEARRKVDEALRQAFRPEFLNRVDEIVLFHELSFEDLTHIVDLQVNDLIGRLHDQKIALTLTQAAKEYLVNEGYNPVYGARPLRRTVQRMLETPISRELLRGVFKEGDTIQVDLESGQLVFLRGGILSIESKRPAEPLGA
ncbi:MAG: AAA domain-containing protein, partial [Oscillochloris sp.]|nr:AAA domain-containing protein [Oscillochloris sp.]